MTRIEADQRNEPPTGRRLDGWQEIADYLRKSVSTVQRWEKEASP